MPPAKTYSEYELVKGLKQHDNAAYTYLYLHYRGSLFTVISQIIKNEETANDVLQEVFTAIWKNIDKYDPAKGRLFTWMLRLAQNLSINKTRSKLFKSEQKNEALENIVHSIEGREPVEQHTNQIGLRKQVGALREEYRQIIELCYFQGFTQEETARVLQIPLGTVKTRLRSALSALRKQFV